MLKYGQNFKFPLKNSPAHLPFKDKFLQHSAELTDSNTPY